MRGINCKALWIKALYKCSPCLHLCPGKLFYTLTTHCVKIYFLKSLQNFFFYPLICALLLGKFLYLSESVFLCSVICLSCLRFCLLYPSALSVGQSPCVLVSAVFHPNDCVIPQLFSIVCVSLSPSLCYLNTCVSVMVACSSL